MTRIRATCPDCGEIELQPDDIELRIIGNDPEDVRDGSTYVFCCPNGDDEVAKPADARIARLLVSGGVQVQCLAPNATAGDGTGGIDHPEGAVDGAPLTLDDLLDFHELLNSPGWFDSLLQLTN